jgi:predicted transcriptional regulator
MNDVYIDSPTRPRAAQPEALRTGPPPVYQGGRIYTPDPAAVARLKRLMEEQRRQKEAAEAARQAKSADTAARLLAAAKARKARQQADAAEAVEPVAPAASPAKVLPDDTIRALHARHVAGESVTDLAAEAGIARTTLGRRFHQLGLEVRRQGRPFARAAHQPRPPRLSADELAAAVAAHNAGQLWREIAAEMGMSRRKLRESLIEAGFDPGHQRNRRSNGPPSKVGADEARALHARWMAGESSAVLAAEAGADPQTLRRRFRQLALPTARTYKRLHLTADQMAAAVAARDAGRPWREIAAEMGVPKTTLRQAVERAGYDTGQASGSARQLTDEQIATAAAQHDQGRPWSVIAAEMGVSERTLRRRVGRAGHDTGAPIRRENHAGRYELTAEEVATVSAARAAGRTWQAIADEQGIGRRALRDALQRAGAAFVDTSLAGRPSRAKRLDEEQLRALYARRLAGEPVAVLAAEVGVKVETLAKALAEAGYPRVVLRHGRPVRELTADDLAGAVAKHEQGRNWANIATGLGTSLPTLQKELRRAGYSTKRVGKGG